MSVVSIFYTGYTIALLVPYIGITESELRLDVKVRRYYPIVAVAESGAGEVTVATLMGEGAVELGAMGMNTNKVSLKTFRRTNISLQAEQARNEVFYHF